MRNNIFYDATFFSLDPDQLDLRVHVKLQDNGTYKVISEDSEVYYDQDGEFQTFDSQDDAIQAAREQILKNIESGH